MKLLITYRTTDGDAHEVTAKLAQIVAWERKYKKKAIDMAQGIGVEDLAFLAYEATRASGIVVPSTLDTFIERIEDIGLVDETENPTQPGQQADS